MPRNAAYTRTAVSAQFDARGWSATAIFSVTGSPRTLPTYSGVGDGIYDDMILFLNGRGCQSGHTMADQILASWPVGGTTLECYIGDDDKLVFKSSINFSITSSSTDLELFGINPSGQATGGISGGFYYLYADNDWQRGNVPHDSHLQFIASSTLFNVYFPMYQDVPTACPVTAISGTLESLSPDSGQRHWGINENGIVWWSHISSTAPLSWSDLDFMRYLGFTGDEAVVAGTSGSYSYALGLCRGYACPYRPFVFNNVSIEEEASAKRLDSGQWVGVHRGTYQMRSLRFYLDGPMDACITVTKQVYDMHQHWLRFCMNVLSFGMPVTIYMDVGDTRLTGYTAEGDEYSTTVTVEENGYRGRLEGYIVNNDGMSAIVWTKRMRRRAPVTLVMQVR